MGWPIPHLVKTKSRIYFFLHLRILTSPSFPDFFLIFSKLTGMSFFSLAILSRDWKSIGGAAFFAICFLFLLASSSFLSLSDLLFLSSSFFFSFSDSILLRPPLLEDFSLPPPPPSSPLMLLILSPSTRLL